MACFTRQRAEPSLRRFEIKLNLSQKSGGKISKIIITAKRLTQMTLGRRLALIASKSSKNPKLTIPPLEKVDSTAPTSMLNSNNQSIFLDFSFSLKKKKKGNGTNISTEAAKIFGSKVNP